MKLSQFNIIANYKENVVVFNTLTNSFLYLNKHIYDRLYDLNYINRLPEINPDLYEKLRKSGVIIDSSFDEYGELLNRHQQAVNDRSIYDLTLLPSLDCNLRCWYCFEKHAKGTHLSKEMFQQRKGYVGKAPTTSGGGGAGGTGGFKTQLADTQQNTNDNLEVTDSPVSSTQSGAYVYQINTNDLKD